MRAAWLGDAMPDHMVQNDVTLSRPNRQWDYPYAWPPHQMLAWEGLKRYGYMDDARRLAYRWLYMITTAFVNFNGLVPEKFDAVALSHLVNAEYGNQGTQFAYVPREGFGWTNASFQVGLTYLSSCLLYTSDAADEATIV